MLTGVVGHIKWRIYTAAAIHGYTVSRSKDGRQWSLVATVVLSNAFNLAQTPLTFVAKHAKGSWTFPIQSMSPVQRDTYQVTARLGPPQEK